jgi:hypothetical protein
MKKIFFSILIIPSLLAISLLFIGYNGGQQTNLDPEELIFYKSTHPKIN